MVRALKPRQPVHQYDRSVAPAFSLIEAIVLIIVILSIVMITIDLILANNRSSASGPGHNAQCQKQLTEMQIAITLFAQDNAGSYPVPTVVSSRTAKRGAQTGNSTANLYSLLIFNTYFAPETVVCPDEKSPNISVDSKYSYGSASDPNINEAKLRDKWDIDFSADITRPNGSNASYANMAIIGGRIKTRWISTGNSADPVFSDRGPKDGIFNAKSLSNLNHGGFRAMCLLGLRYLV